MGMGKTIQTIALLLSDKKKPNLVVAPVVNITFSYRYLIIYPLFILSFNNCCAFSFFIIIFYLRSLSCNGNMKLSNIQIIP